MRWKSLNGSNSYRIKDDKAEVAHSGKTAQLTEAELREILEDLNDN